MRTADPQARRLLSVVSQHLRGASTLEEHAWTERIETLRTDLVASTELVTVVNYGAGKPGTSKTARQMRRGKSSTTTVGAVCRQASKPASWAGLLLAIVREYHPHHAIELGTSLGLSAAYQGAGLYMNGDGGTLHTLEGAPELADLARRHLAGLGLDDVTVVTGRFDQTLGGVLRSLGTIDYAFVDGHHDEAATLAYFETLLPVATPGAVLVFDDISWSDGMRRAWATIAADPRVGTSIGLRAIGICIVGGASAQKKHWDLFLD